MNPLTALRETGQLWDLLADSGGKDKIEAYNGSDLEHLSRYSHSCPACEYDTLQMSLQITKQTCESCVIWDRNSGCISSEYGLWCHAKTKALRKQCACRIATLAWENYGLLYSIGYRED